MSALETSPQSKGIPWWLWINVLSLDAPLLAVIWQAALARCHRVRLEAGCYWALGLAVWVVYMTDRVLDGVGKQQGDLLTARHAFYHRHWKLFAFVIIPGAAVLLLNSALFSIPAGLMWRGLALAFLVAMYLLHYAARGHRPLYIVGNIIACAVGMFLLSLFPVPAPFQLLYASILGALLLLSLSRSLSHSFRLVPKELLCGYLFATGVSMSVNFYTLDTQASPFVAVETLMLALLCGLNCVAIACYEKEHDSQNDPNAITQTWPFIVRYYPAFLCTLAGVAVLALRHHLPVEMARFTMAVLVSTFFLGALHVFAKRLSSELSHVLADVALVTPVVMLVMR